MPGFLKTLLLTLFLYVALFSLARPVHAQAPGEAAFLFAYHPKAGMQALFNEGYRRHLAWHRAQDDPLVWYAWYVVFGQRTGLFIDGTVGIPFAAFDARVDPAGDGADFAQTTAPFADVAFRSVYALRRDLSTGTPLEEEHPSALVQVFRYTVHVGKESQFEGVLRAVRTALERAEKAPTLTWYELAVGDEHAGYMLMIPRNTWADYDEAEASVRAILQRGYPSAEAAEFLTAFSESVKRVESEVWLYQSTLSYFPEQ